MPASHGSSIPMGPLSTSRPTSDTVGAVLWHPSTGRKFYTTASVPDSVVKSWIPKRQMIGQVELFGAVLGLLAFRDELCDCDVLHFVDNDSATSALIKGYSGKLGSAGRHVLDAGRLAQNEPPH
eukprot:6470625-Amphidinium_carterae.1